MQSVTPLQRQWQIVIALMSRRQGMTIKEISTEVTRDQRTIRRDLNSLRKVGFPLDERVTSHGRKHWMIVDGGARVPIHFNWPEAVALYLGRQMLDPLAGTHFWHASQTAFGKIRATLGESALMQLEKVSKSFLQTMPGRGDDSEKRL
jgi:proteasome accessory factor B